MNVKESNKMNNWREREMKSEWGMEANFVWKMTKTGRTIEEKIGWVTEEMWRKDIRATIEGREMKTQWGMKGGKIWVKDEDKNGKNYWRGTWVSECEGKQ